MTSQGEGTLGILEAQRREQSQVPFLMMMFSLMLTYLVTTVWYWVFTPFPQPSLSGYFHTTNDAPKLIQASDWYLSYTTHFSPPQNSDVLCFVWYILLLWLDLGSFIYTEKCLYRRSKVEEMQNLRLSVIMSWKSFFCSFWTPWPRSPSQSVGDFSSCVPLFRHWVFSSLSSLLNVMLGWQWAVGLLPRCSAKSSLKWPIWQVSLKLWWRVRDTAEPKYRLFVLLLSVGIRYFTVQELEIEWNCT